MVNVCLLTWKWSITKCLFNAYGFPELFVIECNVYAVVQSPLLTYLEKDIICHRIKYIPAVNCLNLYNAATNKQILLGPFGENSFFMVCLFRPSSLVGVWLFYTDYFVSSCNAEWGKGVLHSKLPADYTPVLISKWIQGCDLVINPIWMWLSCIRINPINFKSCKQVLYWMLLWLTGTCANHNARNSSYRLLLWNCDCSDLSSVIISKMPVGFCTLHPCGV